MAAWLLATALTSGCADPVRAQPEPTSENAPSARAVTAHLDAGVTAAEAGGESQRLVILAGGDVNLGRYVGQIILRDPGYDPFAKLRPLLATADLRFVNLESQLSDQGGVTVHPRSLLIFTGPPRGAQVLQRAGIDLVSVGNNHMWDYGKRAFLETLDHLERARVAYAGASREVNQAYRPVVVERDGWSVALFAVTHIWNQPPYRKHPGRHHVAWASFPRLQRALAQAREEHDVVLVSYHGGGEYLAKALPMTKRFVRQAMSAGADAVIGHHPHVTQGVQFFEMRPVFYSLGNLVFEPFITPLTRYGLLARLTFDRAAPGGPVKVEACPVDIGERYMPAAAGALSARRGAELLARLRERMKRTSKGLGGVEIGSPDEAGCLPLRPAN